MFLSLGVAPLCACGEQSGGAGAGTHGGESGASGAAAGNGGTPVSGGANGGGTPATGGSTGVAGQSTGGNAGTSGSTSSGGTGTSGGTGASGGAGASGVGGSDAGSGGTPVAGSSGSGGAAGTGGGGSGGGGLGGKGGSAGAPACPNPATLKAAGTCTGRLVGVALSTDHLSETDYANRARQFNYVTPENEMKWDATEPTRNTFTFTRGDQIVDFAVANSMQVKGHTLVWHNQLPTWLTSLTSATDVRMAMVSHIRGLVQHYRGKVIVWDVVNEAFDDNGVLRDSVFNLTIGRTFIEEAFRAAHDADATVKLYYNDFDIENAGAKADAAYQMLSDFKARGVPLDGVGMQMHTRSTNEDPSLSEFVTNLERFLALGLEVTLSEVDVRVCDGGTLAQQAARYHDIVAECVKRPGCGAVTVWGITDKYSWLNERTNLTCVSAAAPRPLLWDDSYAQKPAYTSLLDALAGR